MRNAPEKAEFPGFGLLRQAKNASWGDETQLPEGKTARGGSKEGGWVYTVLMLGAKMEIPAQWPASPTRKIGRSNATNWRIVTQKPGANL